MKVLTSFPLPLCLLTNSLLLRVAPCGVAAIITCDCDKLPFKYQFSPDLLALSNLNNNKAYILKQTCVYLYLCPYYILWKENGFQSISPARTGIVPRAKFLVYGMRIMFGYQIQLKLYLPLVHPLNYLELFSPTLTPIF